MRLLVATNNPGKLHEFSDLLAGLPVDLVAPSQLGIDLNVEETGRSFSENAIIKATAYAIASGLCALADDSGLEVDALGGEPGINSSKYLGPDATDADRVQGLLRRLAQVPWQQRTARFRCAIAIACPGGVVEVTEDTCQGVIAFSPEGKHGFGYDPVFYLPELGLTMAQLPASEKHRISHRAKAARKARPIIEHLARGSSR